MTIADIRIQMLRCPTIW